METSAQRDARCLIERISREHTLDGTIIGTRFELLVSNCLDILSSQLYEKSTHFLLELIQNADDNTYNCPTPTLSFSYKPGSLRIDCNEVGFTAENVEAICAISRSTKSGKTSDGEYIGEKGIGFKSVFKAADVVWIASREFTFKFDKTRFLGMVAPIWADFPETTRPGCTSIYLQLSKGYEEETLIHELLTFDTNLLIFLRRIEEINIRVSRRDEQVWEKKIRKTESRQGTDRVIVLHAGESTFQYLIRTHIIKDLPKERKRPNWPQTKILLAFPTAEFPEQPRLNPQNVYAFLPIRNYGLKFLLQGDFLLTASREDIESTLPWNRTIRDALAEAFLLSILHFNEGQLKYVWPYYLPSTSTGACSFLEPAITSILARLTESHVLESCAGTMVKPSSLKHVPLDRFADREGIPFTLSPLTAASYLSLEYPQWAIEATGSIGVSQLSPQEFLGDLKSAITQDPTTFRTRSATWHSQLAETLIKLATDPELMSMIQDICLIPLHDGNWTSAREQSIFFSKSETSLEIPSGIEVLIVDSAAECDPNRRKLFTHLGVKAWEAAEICWLVLKVHESSNFDPKTLAVDQLISHAAFLYKASWQPPKTADLWFATMQDERCLGRKLYIPGSIETNSPGARIFAQLQKQFAVIHNDYLKAFPLDVDWPMWLVSNLGLSKAPRLITPHVDPKPQPTQTLEIHENAMVDGESTLNDVLKEFDLDSFLREDETDGIIKSSERASKTKIVYAQGEEVAFKIKIPGRTDEQDWVLGKVVKVIGEGNNRRYGVQDPYPDEASTNSLYSSTNSIYRSSASKMVPIPPKGAPLPDYELGKRVLALYPNTTTFCSAKVKAILDNGARVQLLFEDEYADALKIVERRLVLDHEQRQTPPHSTMPPVSRTQAQFQQQGKDRTWPKIFHTRGPVDVEKQCGVVSADGVPCAQSLTCKRHSMGAKRAVPGRSVPYDVLLSAYEKKNQAKQSTREMGPPPLDWPPQPVEIDLNFSRTLPSPSASVSAPNAWDSSLLQPHGFGELSYGSSNGARLQQLPIDNQNRASAPDPLAMWYMGNDGPWIPKIIQEDKLEGERRVETAGDANSKAAPAKITPSAPDIDTKKTFILSKEFTFIFRECHSSDVLQLLRDNWHYYSQWIDGAHMKWQNADFLESSTQLRNSLGACLVQSAKGSLLLQETVLPMIDLQLDEGRLIPAVDVKDPKHPDWRLLSHFGVIMTGDVHYYLRCLIAISEELCPDVDDVAHIYDQIQARYKGNEELISAAFHEREIVLVHSESRGSTKPAGWTNMKESLSRDIAIESEYPSSSYLFRCLKSPIGDPIAPIVATATLITSSTKLEDISRLFRDVSTALEDVNTSKAAQLLRPLQNKSIFPITNVLGKRRYDTLLDVHNKSWFIADRPLIRESFHGKLPLLALPIEDLSALGNLFRVLRLDGRMLSILATSQTHPKGKVTTHWTYTARLRAKSPFIKALIPHSHRNRTTIVRQIDEVRVSVATGISQTFMLNRAGTEIHGSPVDGQVSLSYTGNLLNVLMTEECAAAKCPPHKLVSLIADACEIKDPNHFSLLYTALSSSSMESIFSAFTQQGIYIKEGLVFAKSKDRYRAQRGDLMRIPSPFWGSLNRMGRSFRGLPEAVRFDRFRRGGSIYDRDGDRRLPMIKLIRADGSVFEDVQSRHLVYKYNSMDGWDHVQYLGEHMISKVLQAYLGQAYDPERDWTSKLRSRSGHKPFEDSGPCAAFTMRDPKILDQMTAFVIKYGHSQTPNWKENLRANPPVYHLDLAVSAGSKTSSFVINSSQVERMRQFRMHDNSDDPNTNIVVLVRVSDVYSEDLLSVDLFVDPWRLFDSNSLTFEENWIFKGAIQESSSGSSRKRRKLYCPSVSWAMPTTPGMHQNNITTLPGRRDREIYTHRTLDSGNFRLLYLLPGETGDQLQGVIIHVPYESAGTYRALSYVWGTDQRTQELMTPDGVLRITFSLNKALRGLRHKNKPIMLWVDAICINQEDNEEKAQQIRLLPKIFQTATSTYAFLEGGKGSDAATEMLMQVRAKAAYDEKSKLGTYTTDGTESELGNDSECEIDSGESMEADDETISKDGPDAEDWPENLPRVPASWNDRCIPHLDDAIWASVGAMFALSWFRRVWIIQEIVAAPNVKIVCGKWIIDWNDLHLAVEIIDRQVQLSDNDFSHLKSSWEPFLSLAAQREWEARHYRWTLFMLLENFRYAESTLSRDRLFALLGLASDGNEAEFEPDYDSPLEDIVLKFARVFVRQERGMQLLYRAGLSHQSHRFPSWIPDWTVRRPSSLHDSSEGGIYFAASGPQQAKIKCIPDTDELIVEGYTVDVIESISASSNVEQEWESYFKEVDAMVDSAVLSPVRDSREDLKWKVPIAGVLYPKLAVSGGLDLQSSYTALRNYINGKQKGKAIDANGYSVDGSAHATAYAMALEQMAADSFQKQSTSYIAALQDTLYGCRFVVTKKGYVGVVPNMAEIGDVVAILKGGLVPFILRKSVKRPEAFRLVGECYIHGMMNGEGLSLPGVVDSEFRLH